jgi:hypothetical protein
MHRMASAETFIRTHDGGKVKHFTPRPMQKSNQQYVLKNPDPQRIFVHVEGERGGSEWRPLELFTIKPPLDQVELYGSNDERSKLDRSDPRVVSAIRRAGLNSLRPQLEYSLHTPKSAKQLPASPTEATNAPTAPGEPILPVTLPSDVRDALLGRGTDAAAMVLIRRDQSVIREYLLAGREEADCVVCGSVLPAEFLIAAHIVPRSECTENERLDLSNVALMCSLGCDALFEKGVISIGRGVVVCGPAPAPGETVSARVAALVGRRATSVSAEAETHLERKRALVSRQRSGSESPRD